MLGANVSAAPADKNAKVITTAQGYIDASKSSAGTQTRVFSEREYLAPLGTALINLYRDKGDNTFSQNPGWEGN